MSDIVYLYAALTIALIGLFAYAAYLQRRMSKLRSEVVRLEELVTHARR